MMVVIIIVIIIIIIIIIQHRCAGPGGPIMEALLL